MESPEHARMPESNPFVDIATHLFLEDLSTKVGTAGLNNYLISLANNLAANMPEEEYDSWDEFLGGARGGGKAGGGRADRDRGGGRGEEDRGGGPPPGPPEARGDHEDPPRDAPPEQLRRVAPGPGVTSPLPPRADPADDEDREQDRHRHDRARPPPAEVRLLLVEHVQERDLALVRLDHIVPVQVRLDPDGVGAEPEARGQPRHGRRGRRG